MAIQGIKISDLATVPTTYSGALYAPLQGVDPNNGDNVNFKVELGSLKGEQGSQGLTPQITSVQVQTGSPPSGTISGNANNLTLSLTIPQGEQGIQGEKGDPGTGDSLLQYIANVVSTLPTNPVDGYNAIVDSFTGAPAYALDDVVTIQTYNATTSSWSSLTHNITEWDLINNTNDSPATQWYILDDGWHQLNFSVDLSQYPTFYDMNVANGNLQLLLRNNGVNVLRCYQSNTVSTQNAIEVLPNNQDLNWLQSNLIIAVLISYANTYSGGAGMTLQLSGNNGDTDVAPIIYSTQSAPQLTMTGANNAMKSRKVYFFRRTGQPAWELINPDIESLVGAGSSGGSATLVLSSAGTYTLQPSHAFIQITATQNGASFTLNGATAGQVLILVGGAGVNNASISGAQGGINANSKYIMLRNSANNAWQTIPLN